MLNFKIGQFYKDTDGDDWIFEGYKHTPSYSYFFRRLKDSFNETFFKDEDNSVTQYPSGKGIKIPFVEEEEKERDWVVGEEYECIDLNCQRILTAKLTKVDDGDSVAKYMFKVDGAYRWFSHPGELMISSPFILFKSGIPQELKDRINKGKLTNKQKCFQKEQLYKDIGGSGFIFIKRVKTSNGLFAIFENCNTGGLYATPLKKINNVECTEYAAKVDLCADESIKNKDGRKAVRVKE